MTLKSLTKRMTEWLRQKLNAKITIHIHEGGIRKVRIEHDVN